jgi:DNA polymerase-1
MHVDLEHVARLAAEIDSQIEKADETLKEFSYWTGPGAKARYKAIVVRLEAELEIALPRTPTGEISEAAEDLEEVAALSPFFSAFVRRKELEKIRSTFLEHLDEPIIRPEFHTIVSTGRTSCRNPNLQQIPREGGIREAFVPSPGHLLLAVDYSGIELATLAQTTFTRFGFSRMRALINEGRDLHRAFAAKILGKREDQVAADERQAAKAANFGLPGGLGARTLRLYARQNYGVALSEADAERYRREWFAMFPEMGPYMDAKTEERLGRVFDLSRHPGRLKPEQAAWVLLGIAEGREATKTTGRSFTRFEREWAWSLIERTPWSWREKFQDAIRNREGSRGLLIAATSSKATS